MDNRKKLEILADADFSRAAKILRARASGQKEPPDVIGFKEAVYTMMVTTGYIGNGNLPASRIAELEALHGQLASDYSTIPFDQMDQSDNHFKFLFQQRDRIAELGDRVAAFKQAASIVNGRLTDSPEYSHLWAVLDRLLNSSYSRTLRTLNQ